MINIFFNTKKKEVEPKIYSILYRIDLNNRQFIQGMWTGVDYSLEDAAQAAFDFVKKGNPNINILAYNVLTHTILSFKDLHSMLVNLGAIEVTTDSHNNTIELDEKQRLMKMIINKKDENMLKENKDKFSKSEVQYIKEEIKK